jgi:mannose-1-phosphate guanylyltransferase / mannose-6-phosphate isomerase
MLVVPVVLCGGAGTRLWPVSRREHAKQHIPLFGGASPFQRTLQRLSVIDGFEMPVVIAGQAGRFLAADEARAAGVDIELVIEPVGRDTLPAVTLGAILAARRGPEAVAFVLPSDHHVPDIAAFADAAARAVTATGRGDLVVFGLDPSGPATGFGYIRPGDPVGDCARRVAAFVEKPDAERAAELVAEGCLWNSGMFAFRARAALDEIGRLAPEAVRSVTHAVETATEDLGALRLGHAFTQAPKVSFDVAVMERTDRAVVVPAGFAWSDVGDWQEVWSLSPKDENGVAVDGVAELLDVRNSYVRSAGRLICAIGVEDLVVIDTPDAILVSRMDRTQDVKAMLEQLRDKGMREADTPARVHRPWGWYQTMDLGERFRVKRIQVPPGKQLSLQKHHHRAEHWIVVSGTAEVTRDEEVLTVRENESIYLPAGCVHRLANPGRIPVELIEVQTGSYLEEDDIIRIEDDFGRT